MEMLLDLAAAAFGIFVVMMIVWPLLKSGARSKEAQKQRWKLLWRGGLISWICAVVLTQVVSHLRAEIEAVDRNLEVRIQQINDQSR